MSIFKTLTFFIASSILLFLFTSFGINFAISKLGMMPMIAWFINGGVVFIILFSTAMILLKREQQELTFKILKEKLNLKPLSKRDIIRTMTGISTISIFSMLIMKGLTRLSELYPDKISSSFSPPFLEFHVLDT